jgi:hypothetical protein
MIHHWVATAAAGGDGALDGAGAGAGAGLGAGCCASNLVLWLHLRRIATLLPAHLCLQHAKLRPALRSSKFSTAIARTMAYIAAALQITMEQH